MAKLKIRTGRIEDPYMLPTPSYGLNRSLGGGLLSGRIHVFWGAKASGKTTVALHQIACAQKMGKKCLFVDAEKTYHTPWAENCGVNIDELMVLKEGSNKAEDLLDSLIPLVEKNDVDVVVIDSLSSVLLGNFFEKSENNPIGIFARSAKFILIKLLNALPPEVEIILISHASNEFVNNKAFLTASIGNATAHWASTIIQFRLGLNKTDDFRSDGSRQIYWKIDKSKQSIYPANGSYWFNSVNADIDTSSEIVNIAVKEEIIEKSGAWYKLGDRKFHGIDNIYSAVKDEEELLSAMIKAIEEKDKLYRDGRARGMDIVDSDEEEDA